MLRVYRHLHDLCSIVLRPLQNTDVAWKGHSLTAPKTMLNLLMLLVYSCYNPCLHPSFRPRFFHDDERCVI